MPATLRAVFEVLAMATVVAVLNVAVAAAVVAVTGPMAMVVVDPAAPPVPTLMFFTNPVVVAPVPILYVALAVLVPMFALAPDVEISPVTDTDEPVIIPPTVEAAVTAPVTEADDPVITPPTVDAPVTVPVTLADEPVITPPTVEAAVAVLTAWKYQ